MKQRFGIFLAAESKVLAQALDIRGRQCREARQFRICTLPTGKQSEFDVTLSCQCTDHFHAIGPIGFATEQADDYELGLTEGFFSVEIDGKIVLELEQIG